MPADLLVSPRWQPEDLGLPMPDDPHAVSACLPLWKHNIAYEEGESAVVDRLQAAYPRFCLHPKVRQLCDLIFPNGVGLPFVSASAATRAVEYVIHRGGRSAKRVEIPGQSAVGVAISAEELGRLKEYWQHAGEIVSSRAAMRMIEGVEVATTETAARMTVRQRVAERHGTAAENVFLYMSGMAAIAAAWRTVTTIIPDRPSCQFGFPYVDTLKIQQRFPKADHDFLPLGTAADLERLQAEFAKRHYAAVFSETPTNPLLVTPDLNRLRRTTNEQGALLIVDDTLRACSRQSVLPASDLVATSLTKYFSGYGNVLAGSLVLNPDSAHSSLLRAALTDDFEETLCDMDVDVLERNSRDLDERVSVINRNARTLVERLRQHSAVASVYFPDVDKSDSSDSGGLFSIVLRNPETVTPATFDALRLNKGPNLGTRFTLCCPYTILAHYNELDFAERCGVSRWLLRFSVGVEPVEELWDRLAAALP